MGKYYTPTKLSENISETPEGFLLCQNVAIARTGWMEYGEGETPLEIGESGIIRIHRDADAVFDPVTIASFEGKAVTIKHPADFVTPENWAYLSKGVVQNVRRGDEIDEDGEESLFSDLLIMDSFAIQLVKAGLREVSCGYEAEYTQTGEGEGKQTSIVGNHLALVEQGRAGSTYAINDEKGKVNMDKKFLEKLKAKFGAKVIDAMMEEKKDEPKKSEDADKSYDELVKAVKDMSEKMDGMMKGKDEAKEESKKEEPAKDDMDASEDEEEKKSEDADGSEMEERLKALEAAVAKLLEKQTGDDEEDMKSKDEDMEESEDASEEGEKGEQSQKKKTGDTKARNKTGLETTKNAKAFDEFDAKSEEMTAEKMNELNQAHWARK